MVEILCYRWLYCKMKYYPFDIDSQVNLYFVPDFSPFINEMAVRDYTNNFIIDQIFSSYDDLIEWVWGITFHLKFVVITIRCEKAIGELGRNMFVLLGCKRDGKYKKYKHDAQSSIYNTRKYECPCWGASQILMERGEYWR